MLLQLLLQLVSYQVSHELLDVPDPPVAITVRCQPALMQ